MSLIGSISPLTQATWPRNFRPAPRCLEHIPRVLERPSIRPLFRQQQASFDWMRLRLRRFYAGNSREPGAQNLWRKSFAKKRVSASGSGEDIITHAERGALTISTRSSPIHFCRGSLPWSTRPYRGHTGIATFNKGKIARFKTCAALDRSLVHAVPGA